MSNEIENFQKILGYNFKDMALLVKALTHSSYANENGMSKFDTNERLEFLGDAVLELIISEHIYNTKSTMPEGDMTKLRASIVCEENLSYHAKRLNLGDYIYLGKGERATGGKERDSLLADAFEAVLGAVFLDAGIKKAGEYALGVLMDETRGKGEKVDYKTDLQEIIQKTSKEPIIYAVVSEKGPDHDKRFVSSVSHLGTVIGTGEGRSKKESEQNAACAALALIRGEQGEQRGLEG